MTYPVPPPYFGPPPPPPAQAGTGLAISAMVCGILALLLSWIPFVNIVAGLLALVALGLGIPALVVSRRSGGNAQAFAIAGLVTAAIALLLVLLVSAAMAGAAEDDAPPLPTHAASAPDPAPETAGEQGGGAEEGPQPLPVGQSAEVGNYLVTIDSVLLNGNEMVAQANRYNDPPVGQYVVVDLTVTYMGGGEGDPWIDLETAFVGTDARIYEDSQCSVVLPREAHDAPTLLHSGSASFQTCMDVPPTAIEGGMLFVEQFSWGGDERRYWASQ